MPKAGRKQAAKKIEDKYRSPMNRYGFLHEMMSTQGVDDPQTVKELAHVNLRLHEETKDITDRYKAANLAKTFRGTAPVMPVNLAQAVLKKLSRKKR